MNYLKRVATLCCYVLALGRGGAESYLVTQLGNDGPGTFRDAVSKANAAPGTNVVQFSASGTVALAAPLPEITGHIVIEGLGPKRTILSGGNLTNNTSLFRISPTASAAFRNLAIANVFSSAQGAAITNAGSLTLDTCLIANNQSVDKGGAIASSGQLLLLASTICSNTVVGLRGADFITIDGTGAGLDGSGGGLHMSAGSAVVTNCTFSGNRAIGGRGGDNINPSGGSGAGGGAGGLGGAVFVENGTLTLVNATLTQNQASGGAGGDVIFGPGGGGLPGEGWGGGIYNNHGTVSLMNTVISGNVAVRLTAKKPHEGVFVSLGHNLVGGAITNVNGSGWFVPTDLASDAPQLEALADYGGPTPTHRLLLSSPAVEAGASLAEGAPAFDQRGAARPQPDNGSVDIGAVEFGKIKQTISFGQLADKKYGDAPFTVSAEASSGRPVQFTAFASPHSIVTGGPSGSLVMVTGAGPATVVATEPGDDNYFPADPVSRSFAIGKAPLLVTPVAGNPSLLTRSFGQTNPDLGLIVSLQYAGFVLGDTEAKIDTKPRLTAPTALPNSPVGSYPILLAGGADDDYELTLVQPAFGLTVVPAAQTVSFDAIADKIYTDGPFSLAATADSGLPVVFSLVSGPGQVVGSSAQVTGVGKVTILATSLINPNFTPASASRTFEVKPAPLTVRAANVVRDYGEDNPPLPLLYSGFKPGETNTVLVTQPVARTVGAKGSPVGDYPIDVTPGASPNYVFQPPVSGALTVKPAPLSVRAANVSRSYGQDNPPLQLIYTGFKLGETSAVLLTQSSASVAATKDSPVGDYPISVLAGSAVNYTFQPPVGGTLTVSQASQTIDFTPIPDKAYGDVFLAEAVSKSGAVTNPDLAVSFTVADGPARASGLNGTVITVTNLGTVTITASQAGDLNHSAAASVSRTFTVRAATLSVRAADLARDYGDENPPLQLIYTGFKLGETNTVLVTQPVARTAAAKGSPVGGYPIDVTPGASPNYVFQPPLSGTLTVKPAPLSVRAANVSRSYGQDNPPLQLIYTGFKLGETSAALLTQSTASVAATKDSPVGDYPISVVAGSAANYVFQPPVGGTLTVTRVNQTIDFAPIADKAYGDVFLAEAVSKSGSVTNTDMAVSFTVTDGPARASGPNGTVITVTNLGTITITASQAGDLNHFPAASVSRTFAVRPAPLTVRAADISRPYGEENPPLQLIYTGFKLGETNTVLLTQSTASVAATKNSPVGDYPISVVAGSAVNYTFQPPVAGTLTVTRVNQTIDFAAIPDKAYGDVFSAEAVSKSGAVTNPDLAVSFTVADGPARASGLNGSVITVTNLGTITITASQAGDLNHFPAASVSRTFAVRAAPLTVRAADISRPYGQDNPPLQLIYTGFKLGETNTVLLTQSTASVAATKDSPVGDYPISVVAGSAVNYVFQPPVGGTLTVTRVNQAIDFAPIADKAYGDVFSAEAVSKSGAVTNPDLAVSFTVTDGPARASGLNGTIITVTNLGTITITASQAGDLNHFPAASVSRTFAVRAAPLTVRAADISRPYGQDNPPLQLIYTGFKLGETNTVLLTQSTASVAATKNSPVGDYPISVVAGSAVNYTFQPPVAGTLTVTRVNQTIEFAPIPDKAYGDIFLAEAVSKSGGVTNPDLAVSFTVADGPARTGGLNGTVITVTNLGTVTLTASQAGDLNHFPAVPVSRTFAVSSKAVLTARPKDATRRVGQPNPSFEIGYTGLKLGETSAVLASPPTAQTDAVTASPVGNYRIFLSGGADAHYDFRLEEGVLSVTRTNQPPLVNIASPTTGAIFIQPVDLPLIADATDTDGFVTQIEFFVNSGAPGATNVLIGITNSAHLSAIWTNVPAGSNMLLSARATDNEGATAFDNADLKITVLDGPPVTIGVMDTDSALVRQTGLYQQVVTVSNPTAGVLQGIRVNIAFPANIPANNPANGARVYNATGRANGIDYIQYDGPLAPGKSVDLRIEYYVLTGVVPVPRITARLLPGRPATQPAGVPVNILRVLPFLNTGILVEFATDSDKLYYIQYSSDLLNWKPAWPAVRGNGTYVQWIDSGPPKTESSPRSQPVRFYRAVSVP